jgi:hypothetical protein
MSEATTAGVVARLEAAADELETARAAVKDAGEAEVQRLADAYDEFDELLSRYREPASGSGRETFQQYVEFEGKLETVVEELPEDLLHREAFEAAEEVLNRRRLDERDFDRAREELTPAREAVELLDERHEAERRYRDARRAVTDRRRAVDERLDELESVLTFADADLDAPVETLREPISAYESAVHDAFRAFRHDASARRVLDFVAATEAYPLVAFPEPPTELQQYLARHPAGEEPIPTLLDWAEYTRSKLSHYVGDPASFRAQVAGNRTYLARLDAEPLEIGWPPPPAGSLRYRGRELVAVVERFAPESTVERLNDVRDLLRRPDYEDLRQAAVAADRLDETDRRRLRDGSIQDEVESLRGEAERLDDALETYPDR